jgi:hypothetical protein
MVRSVSASNVFRGSFDCAQDRLFDYVARKVRELLAPQRTKTVRGDPALRSG